MGKCEQLNIAEINWMLVVTISVKISVFVVVWIFMVARVELLVLFILIILLVLTFSRVWQDDIIFYIARILQDVKVVVTTFALTTYCVIDDLNSLLIRHVAVPSGSLSISIHILALNHVRVKLVVLRLELWVDFAIEPLTCLRYFIFIKS